MVLEAILAGIVTIALIAGLALVTGNPVPDR